jgi:hypothetical protein
VQGEFCYAAQLGTIRSEQALKVVAAAIMSSHARPGCSLAALGVVLGVLGAVCNLVG